MTMERLEQQIQFIIEIDKLKQVVRQTYVTDASRCENSVEHSWHLAVMAMILAEHANGSDIDLLRVIKMVLIHDIVEIDAGDTFLYDDKHSASKSGRELAAAARLFNLLPTDQADQFRELWDEFEFRETKEAKFAYALDRLQPMLHNIITKGKAWQKHGVKKFQVIEKNRPMQEGAVPLWDYISDLLDYAVEEGYLSK
ncbi:MAG: HD domain-containing protein [Desulfobacteraceae bacterium]|nr:HD domain-containing protein [Desulfobacteraceae bacterium]MBC2755958.1 HD domain-containing protein [Desulfobacteraceae bacterium]